MLARVLDGSHLEGAAQIAKHLQRAEISEVVQVQTHILKRVAEPHGDAAWASARASKRRAWK